MARAKQVRRKLFDELTEGVAAMRESRMGQSRRRGASRKIRRSYGNVFSDLGFGSGEAVTLKLRSDLMIRLSKLIEARSLSQGQAAELFGVTKPRVIDLVRGKIDRFSIDTLIAMLA